MPPKAGIHLGFQSAANLDSGLPRNDGSGVDFEPTFLKLMSFAPEDYQFTAPTNKVDGFPALEEVRREVLK